MTRRLVAVLVVSIVAVISVEVRASRRRPRRAPTAPVQRVVMPADFEPVDQLVIAWDHDYEDFFVQLTAAAWRHADVVVAVDERAQDAERIADALADAGVPEHAVYLAALQTDSVWMRDYGPFVVRGERGQRIVVDARYFSGGADDQIPRMLRDALWVDLELVEPPLDLEGGNLLSDGRGRCVTTRAMMEDDSRGYSERRIRALLRDHLGCRQLVVLPYLDGEPTRHVDTFVMLTGPRRALVGSYDPDDDPVNAQITDRAATQLRRAGFTVRRIPMASSDGGYYRTYTNSLPLNDIVLVPVYDEFREHERAALHILSEEFPDRQLVPIEASEIITLHGAIHCVTQTLAK